MTLNEYQAGAASTCMESCNNISYMSLGLCGEVGELHSKIAKGIRRGELCIARNNLQFSEDKLSLTALDDFKKGLKGELGDVLWFVAGLAAVCGWSLEEVAQYNHDKLLDRGKRGVIDGNGDNR